MISNLRKGKAKTLLSGAILIIVVLVVFPTYKKYANSAAENSLKQNAPKTAQVALSSFWGDDIKESKEEFSCNDSSRKFAPSDRYCQIQFEVSSTPEKDPVDNHKKYRQFAEALIEDGWSLVYLTSTNSWRDTANTIKAGSELVAEYNHTMNLSGKKGLGKGAWCNLSSHYVPKMPHHDSENGVLKYSIDCYYQVK